MAKSEDKMIQDLTRAACDDRSVMDFAQQKYKENVKLMVGQHYSDEGSENPVPDNRFALLPTVLVPWLAGQKPAVEVTTMDPGLQQTAAAFELAFEPRLDQVRYESMARSCLVSSLFSPFGICKVGRKHKKTVDTDDGEIKVTEPYANEVLFEDFVYDTQARRWQDVQYAADRIEVQFDKFMDENPDIKPEVRDKLAARQKNATGVTDGEHRVSEISSGTGRHRGQYIDTIPIWMFWCRESERIKLIDDLHGGVLIKSMPYKGPMDGPYHFLSYHDVPGQIMPLSPAAILRDAFEGINLGWNKAIAQAEIQKSVYGFRDETVANIVRNLEDGHTFNSQTPQEFQRVDIGGAHQSNVGIAQFMSNVFDNQGYPLNLLGGLGAQSPTATQDAILQGNAGKLIAQMAHRKLTFDQSICEHLAEDMWDDEMFDPELEYTPPGAKRSRFKRSFAPETRVGKFPKYKIRVVPFSTMSLSPRERWGQIMQFVQTTIMPALPTMAQQGIYINWPDLISGWAKANGLSYEMDRALIIAQRQQASGDGAPTKAPVTTRNYERSSGGGGGNPQQHAMQMANMMISSNQGGGGGQGGY